MTKATLVDNLSDSNIQLEMSNTNETPPFNRLQEHFSFFLKKIGAAHEFLNRAAQIDSRLTENKNNDEPPGYKDKSQKKIIGLLDLMNLKLHYFKDSDCPELSKLDGQTVCSDMNADELKAPHKNIKLQQTILQYITELQLEVNKHKKIKSELNCRKEFLDKVLQSGRMHCWDWDIQTNKMNEFGYMASGTSNAGEYTLESFINSVIPEDREKVKQQISQAVAEGKFELELEIEYRSLMVSNTIQWVNFRGKIFYDDNSKPQRMIGVEVIITEHKKIEQLNRQQQNKMDHVTRAISMCEIANILAHDLTEPFADINANVNKCIHYLESDAQIKEPIIRTMKEAIGHVENAGKIIHRMKDFYHKTELHYEKIIITDLIKNVISLIQYENIDDTPTTISFELPENSLVIEANTMHIKQVLLNLIRNSIKVMHKKKIKQPQIIIRIVPKNFYTIIVSIEDNRQGMDADVNELLFTSCFSTKPKDIDMDLAISHSIIEAHGGQLDAHHLPDGGACFQFTISILLSEHDEQAI